MRRLRSSACLLLFRPEVFIQKKGDSDLSVCQSVCPLLSHTLSSSFPLYYYYYYGGAALYNQRNKSYLSPETNYHYGNSLLNSAQLNPWPNERTDGAEAERASPLLFLRQCQDWFPASVVRPVSTAKKYFLPTTRLRPKSLYLPFASIRGRFFLMR